MPKRKLVGDCISVKRPKHVMSLSKKVELLNLLASKETVAYVARRYNISESTLRYIQKREEAIRSSVAAGTSKSAKVSYVCRCDPVIENVVPLSGLVIRHKAQCIYDHLNNIESSHSDSFCSSKGWFENFKKRDSLHNVKLVGESASADHEAAQNFPLKLLEVILENN